MKAGKILRVIVIAAAAALISVAIQIFQWSLGRVTDFHSQHPNLSWALPLAWIFFWLTTLLKDGRDFETTDQILREVATPHRPIRAALAPLISVRTLWSHLFGASVGREGTALQIAGSLADTAARALSWVARDRQALLRAGLAAGLASAYRTPWAAFLFSLELGGEIPHLEKIEGLVASFISFATAAWVFTAPALELPQIDFSWEISADPRFWSLTVLLVLLSPLYKILYLSLNRVLRHAPQPWRWCLGGVAGLTLFALWSQDPLHGLGTSLIDSAFSDLLTTWVFAKKLVVTAVFCATGWFGGDFTPTMAFGSAAGNTMAAWTGFPLPNLGAAIGLFLPVAFTHRILATGWMMTLEYFGWKVALIAAPAFFGAWCLHRWLDKPLFSRLHHPPR